MSARCPACHWEGPPTKVVNGGYCPKCRDVPIVFSGNPLPDTVLKTSEAFNKRALVALKTCSLNEWDRNFVESIDGLVSRYESIDKKLQVILYKVVLRHTRELGDKAVIDFATNHAKGYA